MKKLLLAALLGFVLMTWGSMPLLAQTEIIIHFSGFGVETGGFDYSAPGDELRLITHVTSIAGPPALPYYPNSFEYTLVVTGLLSNGEVDMGDYSNIVYNLGRIDIFEDSSFNSNWAVPGTFSDGSLWLAGPFFQFSMVLFRDLGMGSFDGELTLNAGSALNYFDQSAYVFGGNLIPPHNPGIPPGYHMSIDGEVWGNSTATDQSSLSQIKALY